MKRLFTLILTAILMLSVLSGCGDPASAPETTGTQTTAPETVSESIPETAPETVPETIPEPTQSPEEEKALKIIIVGNSHGNDTFWLLHEVFNDQMPEQEVVLGALYYSGCTVSKHVKFAMEDQYVYDFHRNEDGTWETMNEANIDAGLRNQAWDIVLFQGGRGDTDNEYNLTGRRALEKIVSDRVRQPYQMMWQITWPSPNDPMFFSPDYRVQPPAGWVEYLQTNFGHDPYNQFKIMTGKAVEYLVEDETYEKVICAGAGVMHAHAAQGVPQAQLWRDYTHLSDYGRLITAYCFYAQLTGNAVTEVGIDKIPASLRQKYTRNEGDLIITEEMKQVIIAAANHALEDPWAVYAGANQGA